jgi:hypothetical protein
VKVAIIGLFFILFLGSLYFSLERILYSDSSFILFRVINLQSLQPQEYRYGSFITQGFPLVAAKLHLPLSWIVLLYSASFNLFYLTVAAILVLRLKEYSLGVLMSFYFILFVTDSYYWITNEVHQGIAWMFLVFGLTIYFFRRNVSIVISLPVFLVLAFLSIYTHPLVIFPAIFLWIFFLLEEKSFRKRSAIIFSLILLAVCISKFYFSARGDHYDADKLYVITHHLDTKKILRSLYSPLARIILKKSFTTYWLVPVLFLTGLFFAIRARKYKQAILVILCSLAYLAAICIIYQDFLPFYTESELMPVTIIVTTLFVYYTIPSLRQKTILIILSGIFLFRLVNIAMASEKFTERKDWLFAELKYMREKNIKKGVIYRQEMNQKEFLSYWATPQESIIASALSHDKPNLTFIVGDSTDISKRLPANTMLDAFESWDIGGLNRHYFSFDTTTTYQHILFLNIGK